MGLEFWFERGTDVQSQGWTSGQEQDDNITLCLTVVSAVGKSRKVHSHNFDFLGFSEQSLGHLGKVNVVNAPKLC